MNTTEQPLSYWNNCLLGSFVLYRYFDGDHFEFDYTSFTEDIHTATQLMNIFSDINSDMHPIQEQRDADKFGKRIGIEFTGFADLCSMLHITYGSYNSVMLMDEITSTMLEHSVSESIKLAKVNGPCEALTYTEDRCKFMDTCGWHSELFGYSLTSYGMANTAFLTVGPCGSLSIISDNCSSGIEPIFRFNYKRKNRLDNEEYEFIHYLACKRMMDNIDDYVGLTLDEAKKKLHYVESCDVAVNDKLEVISAAQANIDASISSTTNLKSTSTKEDIYELYLDAWELNLKGITVFRDGCKESVLSTVECVESPDNHKQQTESILIEKELLDVETAERHKVMWKKSKAYVNVSLDDDEPIEIFTKLPLEAGVNGDGVFNVFLLNERMSNWDALGRMISMAFRYGIPLQEVIKQLDKSSYSMVDAAGILSRVLKSYVKQDAVEDEDGNAIGIKCPECGEMTYIVNGGCGSCVNCSYSSCG